MIVQEGYKSVSMPMSLCFWIKKESSRVEEEMKRRSSRRSLEHCSEKLLMIAGTS